MLPQNISETWLEEFNEKLSKEQVPHIARPAKAIAELSKVWKCEVSWNSSQAKSILDWFKHDSPERSHAIGSQFKATYYFDAHFWKISIPYVYGTVDLKPSDCIEDRSSRLKTQLESNKQELRNYVLFWVNLLDYGTGINEAMSNPILSELAKGMIKSADQHLRATVGLLVEDRQPNSTALHTARMATEMFLKAYLAAHCGMDSLSAQKDFSHDIEKLANACLKHAKDVVFTEILNFRKFPNISSRYSGEIYERETLWNGYRVAQQSATACVRSLTNQDSRNQMQSNF